MHPSSPPAREAGGAATYLASYGHLRQQRRHRRSDGRDHPDNRPLLGNNADKSRLSDAVSLKRVGNGHGVVAGELAGRGGRGGGEVEGGDDVGEAFDDGLAAPPESWLAPAASP